MKIFSLKINKNIQALALGAESAGNFSAYKNGKIYFSRNFGDLLEEKNFSKFQKAVLSFLNKEKINPDIILTDLHPLFKTTGWGKELAEKYDARHIQVQHHIAHIFSQIGGVMISNPNIKISKIIYGIVLDGTGYGFDGKIWGGEIFRILNLESKILDKIPNSKFQIERIGKLENQIMIGGDLAVREPARMLISVLRKIKNQNPNFTILRNMVKFSGCESGKRLSYHFVKKYYTKNQFELLYNQLRQNFNCQETSSAGRILDAVSVLLGFAKNQRNHKHEAARLLEINSSRPYTDLKPSIKKYANRKSQTANYQLRTTRLFEYLLKNLRRDKHRLAATAQLYLAQGLHKIVKKHSQNTKYKIQNTILSGGISDNKIISDYFQPKNKTGILNESPVIPRGDTGISFGQILGVNMEG